MKAYFEKEIRIGVSQCDAGGKLRPDAAFTLFQDVASEHAEKIGVGFDDMSAAGAFWVTVRTRVHFYGFPKLMQPVQLSTWPAAPGKTRCDRSYRICAGDEILAEGRTEWCVMDLEKGSVKNLDEVPFREDLEYLPETALSAPYARFRHNFTDENLAHSHRVRTTDIDVGRHMNNVAYLRALLDSFCVAELEKMRISEMEIMFLSPCFEGDELSIMRRATDYGYEFGVRRPDGRYAALALMRAEEK